MKKQFDIFLKKHKAFRKFYANFKKLREKDRLERFFKRQQSEDYILAAFEWDESKEKHNYWSKLDNLWREEIK